MAAQAQKVITGTPTKREQEMSLAKLVDTITGMLLQLPAPQRLEVLRQVEARIKPTHTNADELVRKVIRVSRSFKISLPRKYAGLEGSYVIQVENGRLIYIPKDKGDVKIRNDKSSRVVIVPLPKWAYEQIGSPLYVKVRFEDSRIIVEPV